MELIGEGRTLDNISSYEPRFREGQSGEIRFYLERSLTQEEIDQLESEICGQGVTLTGPIVQDARIVSIKFQKAIPPLLIIALAVGGILTVGTGLIGWQLWKSPLGIPWWVWLIGAGSVLYLLFREPAKKAGGLAIKAGKVYVTRKAMK